MIRFLTPFKKREARVLLGLKDSANALCFKPDKTLSTALYLNIT